MFGARGPREGRGRQAERIALLAGYEQQAEVLRQGKSADHGQLWLARPDLQAKPFAKRAGDHGHPACPAGQQDRVRPLAAHADGLVDGRTGELDDLAEQVRGGILQARAVDVHVAVDAGPGQPPDACSLSLS